MNIFSPFYLIFLLFTNPYLNILVAIQFFYLSFVLLKEEINVKNN
jgi:hypothetical protein